MQKLLVCLTLAAFATITSLQAGEQCATAAKTSCSEQVKATSCTTAKTEQVSATTCTAAKTHQVSATACTATKTEQVKASCSEQVKASCSTSTVAAKSCCASNGKVVAKKRVTEKGGALLVRR